MESFIKATVMFLLTFTMPTKTTDYEQSNLKEVRICTPQQEPAETSEETGNFWFSGFLLIAE